MNLYSGNLCYPVDKFRNIIDEEISKNAKEIIAVLSISNNGAKKEIRFLCDGYETQSSDVSEHLQGDLVFPVICLYAANQQVTTIPIDQIKTRTPEIERLILVHHYLPQRDELERTILHQHQILVRELKELLKFENFQPQL